MSIIMRDSLLVVYIRRILYILCNYMIYYVWVTHNDRWQEYDNEYRAQETHFDLFVQDFHQKLKN